MKEPFTFHGRMKFFLVFLVPCLFMLSSCQKEINELPAKLIDAHLAAKGMIIMQNNSPGQIRVTINRVSEEKYIAPNGMDTLYGDPLTVAKVVVETVVTDINESPAGMQLVFQYALNFPEDKKSTLQAIDIPANFFFVNVINLSSGPATRLAVSEPGIAGITNCDMLILNNRKAVACGYYVTNSLLADIQVIKDNDGTPYEWDFNNIKLPGTLNQSITVTCN